MNDDLTKEFINTLKNQKRPEKIEATIYGLYSSENRSFLYSDADKKYNYKKQCPENKTVRSVKAFALAIAEELRRRENNTGDKATVKINLEGGDFIPDDNFGGYHIEYKRLNSQQWNFLKKFINQTLDHREFMLFLQGLKPSINKADIDFQTLFATFSSLRIVGQSKLVSNPIITNNGQESGYTCVYKLSDGTDGEEHFPTGFTVTVPFAKAGDFEYTIDIDLLFSRDESDRIEITVLCPDFENIEEKAVINEARFIKEETLPYSDLLVLSDF